MSEKDDTASLSAREAVSVSASTGAAPYVQGKPAMKFTGRDLPPEILAGIGEIVAQWSYLAYQMTVILRVGLKLTKEQQRAILVGCEVGVLCGQMRTLAETDHWLRDKAIRDEIDVLAVDIRQKSANRNDYAHAVFGYFMEKGDPEQAQLTRMLMKSGTQRVKPLHEEVTAVSLKAHADVAYRLWERAQAITDKMKGKESG